MVDSEKANEMLYYEITVNAATFTEPVIDWSCQSQRRKGLMSTLSFLEEFLATD